MSARSRQWGRFGLGSRGWTAALAMALVASVVTTGALGATGSSGAAKKDSVPAVYGGSGTRNEPGWVPYSDPESVSVLMGRRPTAPILSEPFHGGTHSMTAMGRAVCRALHRRSADSLLALCVTDHEFRDILWPEFPNSRPAMGIDWQDAWLVLFSRLHGGTVAAMGDWGGHYYEFLRWEHTSHPDTIVHYKNFKLHNHMILVARDDQGEIQRFRWLRSIAERKGVYKIYSMQD
jgi:hypothetical protein